MNKASQSKITSPIRRAIFGGVVGGVGSVFGTLLMKPLGAIIGDDAPWVLPAIGGGVVGALLLIVLLLPLGFKRVSRE